MNVVEESALSASTVESMHSGTSRSDPAGSAGRGHVPVAPGDRSPVDALALSALAAIRDVSMEVARLLCATATRVTDGTPVAPLVRALLGDVRASLEGHATPPDVSAWAARVADAEQALALAVQRATQLEERHERTVLELREAGDRERALRGELAATLERTCAERESISRRADELAAIAEEKRAAAAREAEAARAQLATIQQASLAQRNELSLARSDTARLGAIAEEAQQARTKLEDEAQGLRARLSEAQDKARTLEIDVARAAEERRRAERAAQGEQAEREARSQEQLSELRLEHGRERDRAQVLAEQLERQRVETESNERRELRLREELREVTARAEADREETVRRAQEMVQVAERARAAANAELEAIRSALSNDKARLHQIQAEHVRAEQGVAEREAALSSAQGIIRQLEASRAAAAAEAETARAQLAETESKLWALQHELRLAQRQLDKLCTAHDDLVEDHARTSALLDGAHATETNLWAQTDGLRGQIRSLETERARLLDIERKYQESGGQHADASERVTKLEAELEGLRRWVRTVEDEVAQSTASLEQSALRERRLQEALAATEASMREHEGTLREARAMADAAERERATAAAELEALRTAMASAQRVVLEAEAETRVARAEAERLAVAQEATLAEQKRMQEGLADAKPRTEAAPAPSAAQPAARTAPVKPAAPVSLEGKTLVVLDAGAEWPAVSSGTEVRVITPGDSVASEMASIEAGACIVNVARADALTSAVALRTGGVPVPFWAVVVANDGDRGIWLGPIDILIRPIEAEAVRAQCTMIAPKSARILAVGSDSATFIPLRQGLMKAGMSVSIAWDLKQASELIDIVHPHVVVLDLGLPARRAAGFVTELSRVQAPPALVVIPGPAETLTAFSNAIVSHIPAEGARTRANLLRRATDAATKPAGAA